MTTEAPEVGSEMFAWNCAEPLPSTVPLEISVPAWAAAKWYGLPDSAAIAAVSSFLAAPGG
ncbi:hypothetical protein ACFQX7_16060 [Luedemannella flava]